MQRFGPLLASFFFFLNYAIKGAPSTQQSAWEDWPVTGAQASVLRPKLPSRLWPRHPTAAPQGPGGGRGKAVQPQQLSRPCWCPTVSTSCPTPVAGRGPPPHVLCPAEGLVTFPCCEASDGGPPTGGAASGQVVQVHLRDRVSPVAEGAELRAGKGGVLFLVEKWEHVFHELTQSVIPGRRNWGGNTPAVTHQLICEHKL